MLVINIPKGGLLENAVDIGQLEKKQRIGAVPNRAANHAHKGIRRRDMLQRVPAANDVRIEVSVLLAIEILNKFQAIENWSLQTTRDIRWINADPVAHAKLNEQGEEFSFAASNL